MKTDDNIKETPVQRLKFLLEQNRVTQVELARRLDTEKAYLSKVLSGKLPLTERFVNKLVLDLGISKDWLMHGTDVPFPKPGETTFINGPLMSAPRGTAVYDIDVAAGTSSFERALTNEQIMGFVDMPQVSRDSVIVRVSGDSMQPAIPNGSFIAIRPIPPAGTIFWGQIYVVVTENYRMVKFLRRNPDPRFITLHSDNPAYDDIELPREEIQNLYIVETVISYDRRC